MNLVQTTESFNQDDQSWLASAHGTDTAEPVTLKADSFTSGTHYPDGFLKSGIVLGKITATGLYGPYDNAAVDGREVAVGILFTAVALPTVVGANTKPQGAMLRHCIVHEAELVGIDANGKTDLAGRVIFR